ncbi:MAG: hypothetical protein IKL08_03060 [Clostridia bacterium]|nr:hypothetical protein [Clostridia bacterium]
MHTNSNGITITATKWPADHELDALTYAYNDILTTQKYYDMFKPSSLYRFAISKVIFNRPATIILWTDGSKTIVKCAEDEIYDAEKGFAMAVCKKLFGGDFKKVFKEFVPEEEEYISKDEVITTTLHCDGQKLVESIKALNKFSSLKYNKEK